MVALGAKTPRIVSGGHLSKFEKTVEISNLIFHLISYNFPELLMKNLRKLFSETVSTVIYLNIPQIKKNVEQKLLLKLTCKKLEKILFYISLLFPYIREKYQ